MNRLQIERADRPFPGTYWRPISRITSNGARLNTEQLKDVLSGREPGLPLRQL